MLLEEITLSNQWRHIKILLFKKSGKEDYAMIKAWRLIMLLIMLGKVLELVVAKRISYIVKIYSLFSINLFRVYK